MHHFEVMVPCLTDTTHSPTAEQFSNIACHENFIHLIYPSTMECVLDVWYIVLSCSITQVVGCNMPLAMYLARLIVSCDHRDCSQDKKLDPWAMQYAYACSTKLRHHLFGAKFVVDVIRTIARHILGMLHYANA